MVPLQQEKNIEVLRAYALLATQEVERLSLALAEARRQEVTQEALSEELRDKYTKLQQTFLGFGRETVTPRPPTHHGDAQLLLHGERQSETTQAPSSTAASKNSPSLLFCKMDGEALKQEALSRGFSMSEANDWEEAKGLTQDSVEITVTERVYEKVVIKRQKYRFRPSIGTDKEIIVTAPGPVKINPGCQYSVDFGLSVVSDKYEYHLPLERQRRKMAAAGLDVSVKTLYGLCEAISNHAQSVLPQIKEDIFNDRSVAVHFDETTWPILGSESQSYLWVMSNRSATYYQFEPTRSGKIAEEMLEDYQGAILSDGFSGYNRFKSKAGIIVGNCWAHARREFYNIYSNYPVETAQIIELIDELFKIERKAKTWPELEDLRKRESTAVIDRIKNWLFEQRQKHFPSSGLVKAIDYTLGRWKELTAFLTCMALPLTNNDAERSLRHSVLGRKNFAGSKTINGADTAATLYTIIESAKKASLQPKEYLKYLISERWNKREPLSPLRYSWALYGKPKKASQ